MTTTPIIMLALLFILLPQLSLAALSPAEPVKATEFCKSTLFPGYCAKVLRQHNDKSNVYEYAFFSLKRSNQRANLFLLLVNKQISRIVETLLTQPEIRVLEDCRILVGLNLDYLEGSFSTLSVADNKTLSDVKAEEVHSLMSAIITNQKTCLEGLNNLNSPRDWIFKIVLLPPLFLDAKLFSVALSLVFQGWIPNKGTGEIRCGRTESESAFRHDILPFKKPPRAHQILDSQMTSVKVSDFVTVSKDGGGNYNSIMEAVPAAPNNNY